MKFCPHQKHVRVLRRGENIEVEEIVQNDRGVQTELTLEVGRPRPSIHSLGRCQLCTMVCLSSACGTALVMVLIFWGLLW